MPPVRHPHRSLPGHRRPRTLVAAAATLVAGLLVTAVATPASAAPVPLSQGRPATASSIENAGTPASAAFDGNTGTRWSSQFSDPQWLQVDLGATDTISSVTLIWETAYATAFQVQTSPDGSAWTTIFSTTTGTGGTQHLAVSGTGRYVRMYGTTRHTPYGYSLWEFAVNVSGGGGGIQGGGPLGSNVIVFDPSLSGATIQSQLDSVFNTQQSNQFGTQRYALLFKPGSYSGFNAQIGFYTSIMGLGRNPDDCRSTATSRSTRAGTTATPRRTSGGRRPTWRCSRRPGSPAGRWPRPARSAGWTSRAT